MQGGGGARLQLGSVEIIKKINAFATDEVTAAATTTTTWRKAMARRLPCGRDRELIGASSSGRRAIEGEGR